MLSLRLAGALAAVFAAGVAGPQAATPPAAPDAVPACHEDAGWNEPAAPFRIYGDTWFVGTCGISAILVTSPAGHVLIDGGTAEAAPLIEANIRRLGFRLADVHDILVSHAHSDHVGGIARLQRDTGAEVLSRDADAAALARGRGDRSDPQFLIGKPFAPVHSVRRVEDGDVLRLGGLALTAHATPGHTPGSTSWTWVSCEGATCRTLAYVDSLTAMSDDSYRFTDDAAHPGVLSRMRASIAAVAALPCDILLTPHPDLSAMWSRFGPRPTLPVSDPAACRALARGASAALDARIARENRPSGAR